MMDFKIWRSGDDLGLSFSGGPLIVLTRDEAITLVAEINLSLAPPAREIGQRLSKEMWERVAQRYAAGERPSDLASEAGVSVNHVLRKVRGMGVPPRNAAKSEAMRRRHDAAKRAAA